LVGTNLRSFYTTDIRYLASYKNRNWKKVSSTNPSGGIQVIEALPDDKYLVGSFGTIDGRTMPGFNAIWNGYAWVYNDIILSRNSGLYAALYNKVTDEISVYYQGSGTAIGSSYETVTNPASVPVYPIVTLYNSGTASAIPVYQIENRTTGKFIYFNLSVNLGETIKLDLRQGKKTLISDFRGNILNKILAGSDITDFTLSPGSNSIGFLANGALTVGIYWDISHISADGR